MSIETMDAWASAKPGSAVSASLKQLV